VITLSFPRVRATGAARRIATPPNNISAARFKFGGTGRGIRRSWELFRLFRHVLYRGAMFKLRTSANARASKQISNYKRAPCWCILTLKSAALSLSGCFTFPFPHKPTLTQVAGPEPDHPLSLSAQSCWAPQIQAAADPLAAWRACAGTALWSSKAPEAKGDRMGWKQTQPPTATDGDRMSWNESAPSALADIQRIRAGGVLYDTIRRAVVVRHRALQAKGGQAAAGANSPQSGDGRRRGINVTHVTLVTQFSRDRCALAAFVVFHRNWLLL
jgi:hypothetical protein